METDSLKKLPRVVIFGRANVGKSTLFNRLIEKNRALTSKIAGTTRDVNTGEVAWRGRRFELIDTGGILNPRVLSAGKKKKLSAASEVEAIQLNIEKRASLALRESDLILFTVDSKAGLTPADQRLVLTLKKIVPDRAGRVILVVNKADSPLRAAARAADFFKLSLGEPQLVSAASGSGTGDLLDKIIAALPAGVDSDVVSEEPETPIKPDSEIRAIIIGQPNVGKSSFLNRLIGSEKVIVSPLPHTTREPQDELLRVKGQAIRLIDTAGLSKKGRQPLFKDDEPDRLIKDGIARSLGELRRADIAILVLDVSQDLTRQDAKIVEDIIERQKSLIFVANKWDLVETKDTVKFKQMIYDQFPYAQFAPILFISALTGSKTADIFDLLIAVARERKLEISPSQLNTFLMKMVRVHRPAKGKGVKHPHIHSFTQTNANPPRFEIRIGSKDDLHFSYVRFISNRLREKFGFTGTPIKIEVSKNRKVHGKQN